MRDLLSKFLFVISVFGFVNITNAQVKELTADQMLHGKTKDILKPLPKVGGWKDDTHYILYKPTDAGYDTVLVSVSDGKEISFKPDKRPSVYIKDKDIFYKSASGEEKQLTHDTIEEKNPTLSPDGNKVAFTRNNDLFVVDVSTGKEDRLTNDGSDVVYNGWASWVYYEEILGRSSKYRAFWWSPNSKSIAYMHFNDSMVPMFPLFGAEGQHGYVEKTRYPEAGDPNPEVKIGIVNIETKQTTWSDFNEHDDQYFGTPLWTPDGSSLWVQWMNRHQNHLIVYSIDPSNGNKKSVYDEQQKTWVRWLDTIYFLQNNNGYIFLTDKSGWMHIYRYDMNGNLVKQITNGDWTVKNIEEIDEKKEVIYFTARKENSTRYDLYSIKMNGTNLQRLTFGDYTHTVNVSSTCAYFITAYSNVNTPTKIALVDNKGKVIREIADSKGDEFNNYKLAKIELLRVSTPDGFQLPVLITWPMNMDSTKKYPVLISIYGGPNAGTVYDGWKGIGENQWWAKEGLVQVAIDHRGSGHFGKVGQNYLYKDLGDWEIKDYSEVVKWLMAKSFINKNKIGITGFSYGGYTTCMALTRGAEYFTHGFAGGSVTDWHLYDTHYTERFMGLPSENMAGYKSSAVTTYVNNYKGNLYIVHGTMDDNVHMQNTIQLVGALQDAGKDFEMMLYPGGRHGWSNLKERWMHFENEKAKYIYQYLLEKPVSEEFLKP